MITLAPFLHPNHLTTQTSGDRVPSPCVSVCAMDRVSGLCTGCLRTLAEIAQWSVLEDDERRAVWAALPLRRSLSANENNVTTPNDGDR